MNRNPQGLSLVETMVAMAITSVMMMALFQAVNTSFSSFRANQAQGMLAIRTRATLMRILDHIRATAAQQPVDPVKTAAWQASPVPVDDTGIRLAEVQSDGSVIRYTYLLDSSDPANPQLKLRREVPSGSTYTLLSENVLLNGVSDFKIRMWSSKSNGALPYYDQLARASISLQVQEQTTSRSDGHHLTGANTKAETLSFCGSTVPRQNAWTGARLPYSVSKLLSTR